MNRLGLVSLTLAAALGVASCGGEPPQGGTAAPESPAAASPTATSPVASNADEMVLRDPVEVIESRRELMLEAEDLMKPIDGFTVGEPATPDTLRAAAARLEPLLRAVPDLFPPTTNLFDPTVLEPVTTALPTIWQRFPAFRTLAENAERAAAALRATRDDSEALRAASVRLRTACDACHRPFSRPYTPPKVTDEDLNFDFESALPPP